MYHLPAISRPITKTQKQIEWLFRGHSCQEAVMVWACCFRYWLDDEIWLRSRFFFYTWKSCLRNKSMTLKATQAFYETRFHNSGRVSWQPFLARPFTIQSLLCIWMCVCLHVFDWLRQRLDIECCASFNFYLDDPEFLFFDRIWMNEQAALFATQNHCCSPSQHMKTHITQNYMFIMSK